MKNRSTIVIAFLLIISGGNCIRMVSKRNVRTFEFLSVFVLLTELPVQLLR
ncbi:MAG TPA: hypothetical protein VL728_17815 [Cyclobacteriaceae bacterium]|nr:hypothetical protein [Cyclobacteriaceae bacterium]